MKTDKKVTRKFSPIYLFAPCILGTFWFQAHLIFNILLFFWIFTYFLKLLFSTLFCFKNILCLWQSITEDFWVVEFFWFVSSLNVLHFFVVKMLNEGGGVRDRGGEEGRRGGGKEEKDVEYSMYWDSLKIIF